MKVHNRHIGMKPWFLGFFLLALPAFCFGPKAEMVLHNGTIFTSDERQPWAEAIAIRRGVVLKVGSNTSVMRLIGPQTQVIDLEGRLVVPGFNDAHAHAGFFINTNVLIDTGNFVPTPGPDAASVYNAVAQAAATTPAGQWLYGVVGTTFLDDPQANRFQLDTVSPNHPVYLYSWAGHGLLINSVAMNLAGIAEDEPDPPGGFYDRVDGSNIINGFLHEYAEHRFSRFLKNQFPAGVFQQQYLDYAQVLAGFGTTSTQDMAIGLTKYQSEQLLEDLELPIRWRDICFPLDPDESCRSGLRHRRFDPDNRLTSTGIKWITDGSPIERFAHTSEPYSDLPGWFGFFNWPDRFVEAVANSRRGNRSRNQLIVHAVGDQAIENLLEALDASPGRVWRNRRVRVEHGDLLRPDQMEIMKRHNVILVQNPLHFTVGPTLLARYGPARFSIIQPMRTVLDEGLTLALGADLILGPPNPFLDIFFAVIHPANPAEAITVAEAVTAYTYGSAFAEFQEHVKGRLRRGMFADLAVLSQDIFTIPVGDIPATTSHLTLVGGEVVHDDGTLNTGN